jgi:pimeloyl-ACP methyl ester carboxylesterase
MKLTIQPDDDDNDGPHTKKRQTKILGWPTDTICIDFLVSRTSNRTVHEAHALHVSSTKNNPQKELQPTPENRPREVPHTVLCLIPGNPGQLDWYVSDLVNLVTKLGRGYAARAISHAGHSLNGGILDVEKYSKRNRDADKSIPWTVDGQILHKCAYLDSVISELNALQKDSTGTSSYPPPPPPPVRFLFLGHSFGCHVVQRMCILRPDILDRTDGFLYLMPFIRMDADRFIDQAKLNFGASSPETLISLGTGISHIAKILPVSWLDFFVRLSIQDDTINEIALRLLRQPTFAKNFFQLGTEEIRDIPSEIDVSVAARKMQNRKKGWTGNEVEHCF